MTIPSDVKFYIDREEVGKVMLGFEHLGSPQILDDVDDSLSGSLLVVSFNTIRLLEANRILPELLEKNKIFLIADFDRMLQWRKSKLEYKTLNLKNLYRLTDTIEKDPNAIYFDSCSVTVLDLVGRENLKEQNLDPRFFCMMKRPTTFRNELVRQLDSFNLLDKGHVIYHGNRNPTLSKKLIQQQPFEDLSDHELAYQEWLDGLIGPQYNQFALELVCETLLEVFITEKTMRPITAGMPFIIYSGQGHLAMLRSMGFKTYNEFFDEGYDDEPDDHVRLKMVVELLNRLQNDGTLASIYKNTRDIAKHNLENAIRLKDTEIERLSETLGRFIDQRHN